MTRQALFLQAIIPWWQSLSISERTGNNGEIHDIHFSQEAITLYVVRGNGYRDHLATLGYDDLSMEIVLSYIMYKTGMDQSVIDSLPIQTIPDAGLIDENPRKMYTKPKLLFD